MISTDGVVPSKDISDTGKFASKLTLSVVIGTSDSATWTYFCYPDEKKVELISKIQKVDYSKLFLPQRIRFLPRPFIK